MKKTSQYYQLVLNILRMTEFVTSMSSITVLQASTYVK